ncbi:sensor histidine kinase [Paractinoplanes maris]|uniref:sensor histidine kinase n=1 Tax=Paractinoplanes maris TaxID=1734446 RepID=UPI002020B441|nr:sensor histidine kinase [Actinoplanes maris]
MNAATPSLLLRRFSRGQLIAVDGLLAAAAVLLCWYAAAEPPTGPVPGWFGTAWSEPGWASFLIGLAIGLPVTIRRPWPVAAAVAVLTAAVFAVASGAIPYYAGTAPIFPVGLVLYTVGLQIGRRRSVPVVVAAAAAVAAAFGATSHDAMGTGLVTWVAAACWATGRVVRERRAHTASRAEQATALAVEQERLRIARELHDIVAHSMSMIAVKATIADHVGDEHPEEMREALRVIATTSRETLGEIRRALGVIRAEAAMGPMPTLADLAGLVAVARSTGLTVELDTRTEADVSADDVPDDVALSVYRVVQEALTNVVRHSGAQRCRIEIVTGDGQVDVEVIDDGGPAGRGEGSGARTTGASGTDLQRTGRESATPRSDAGQGLIGMRERAAQFGGELNAGPRPGGGWAVATTMRYEP